MDSKKASGRWIRTMAVAGTAALLSLFIFGCVNPAQGSSATSPPSAAKPTISVQGSGVARTVTISSTTSGASIYYTTDGSTPTTSSTLYTGPLLFGGDLGMTEAISAMAVKSGIADSSVAATTVDIGSIPALSLNGAVSTFAGSTTSSPFYYPQGITTDGTDLFVADSSNNDIKEVDIATGTVTILAGSGTAGSTNGVGTKASFNNPYGITTDGTNLYVGDTNNSAIRKVVIATGAVTTLASGVGQVYGITTDGTDLYFTLPYANEIDKLDLSTGAVTVFAGSGTAGSANGTGTKATFNGPYGITTDGTNFYVADNGDGTIREIVKATGVVSTIATGAGNLAGITTDGTNLYVTNALGNSVEEVSIANGTVTTLAGSGSAGSTNATGTSATFNTPHDITTDGTDLYVADSANNEIREIK